MTVLDGIRDHTASIVSSDAGPARIVRVMRGGSEVCWVFSLEIGEERPQFYPTDLPFSTDLPCTVTWDDETGVTVKWNVPPSPEWDSQMKESMARLVGTRPAGFTDLSERLRRKTTEDASAVARCRASALPAIETRESRSLV